MEQATEACQHAERARRGHQPGAGPVWGERRGPRGSHGQACSAPERQAARPPRAPHRRPRTAQSAPRGSRGATRPRRRPPPPPAQTPALGASSTPGTPESTGGRAGTERRRLRGAARLTYLRRPHARVRPARDNGASAANTPRISMRGVYSQRSRYCAIRAGRPTAWSAGPAGRACPACALWTPGAAGPGPGGRRRSREVCGPGAGPGRSPGKGLLEWAGEGCVGS